MQERPVPENPVQKRLVPERPMPERPVREGLVPEHPDRERAVPEWPVPERPVAERLGPGRSAAEERPGPLGPIFPPRPAAESEVAPMAGPATPAAFNAGAVASLAGAIPAGELRNALDLLLRYAAHVEGATPRPAAPEPKLCDGKPFGITAETGDDT